MSTDSGKSDLRTYDLIAESTITVSSLVVASAAIRSSGPRASINRAALGASLLDRCPHERVDQLFELNLARDGLRHLDDRREIELLDRGSDCARVRKGSLFLPKVWVHLVELSHFPVSAPRA